MADAVTTLSQGFERFTATGIILPTLSHDEGDGTYSRSVAAHMRIWNGSQWARWDGTVSGLLGGGGGGAVTLVDGADLAQGSTLDAPNANTVVGQLKGINSKLGGTIAVSLASNTPDVTDRSARLLGHVTVDNVSFAVTGPLTDAQLRASAIPVSLAAAIDVSDRTARLLGHVTVDSLPTVTFAAPQHVIVDTVPTTPVTGTFWQVTQPISGTVTLGGDSVGLAKDASLTSIFGTPTSDSPGTFTALDQLSRIRKTGEQAAKTLQALLSAATPAPARKTQPTLLHRS